MTGACEYERGSPCGAPPSSVSGVLAGPGGALDVVLGLCTLRTGDIRLVSLSLLVQQRFSPPGGAARTLRPRGRERDRKRVLGGRTRHAASR
jgi:hypothetical protein